MSHHLARIWEGSAPVEKTTLPRVGLERGIGLSYLPHTILFLSHLLWYLKFHQQPIPWVNEGLTSGKACESQRVLGDSEMGGLASWEAHPT